MEIALALDDIRAVAGYAAACARPALVLFETGFPDDSRPRLAIEVAEDFANGAARTQIIRDHAWAAQKAAHAARTAGKIPASEAARAALAACGAAFLHPLHKATQVKHILGSAGHAARAFELSGEEITAGSGPLERALSPADPAVLAVLQRYPQAPAGGGRVGELIRQLDASLRSAAAGKPGR